MKNSRGIICALAASFAVTSMVASPVSAQGKFQEPVFRVSKNPNTNGASSRPAPNKREIDKVLEMANSGLATIRNNIADYRCKLVKRERINGKLMPVEQMYCKIRNRKVVNGQVVTPFSVYMYFLQPNKGREVMYVEGRNNDKLCAREGGLSGKLIPTVWLKPDSGLAMKGQRYPLTDVGIENLVVKLIEKGRHDKRHTDTKVVFRQGAKIKGRPCTVIEVTHPVKRPGMDFHIAQVFIDKQLNIPVRYAAYSWPTRPGGPPMLEEEYTYVDLKVNVGLTDADFDHTNENYNFVRAMR